VSANTDLVLRFIDCWNQTDLDKLMGFFNEQSTYHNIPNQPAQGLAAIRQECEMGLGMATKIEWLVHNIAETENGSVMTERTDKFLVGEHWIELPVMGTFDIEGDIFTAWRDYFDLNQFMSQIPQQ